MNITKMTEIFKESIDILGEECPLSYETLEKNNTLVLFDLYETAGTMCYVKPYKAMEILKIADEFAMELNINTCYISDSIRTNAALVIKGHSMVEKDGSNYKDKKLYIIEFDNGTVKIGIAKDYKRRKQQIKSANGMKEKREHITMPIKNVSKLEASMHREFKLNRLNGEYFDIDFEHAVNVLKEMLKEVEFVG